MAWPDRRQQAAGIAIPLIAIFGAFITSGLLIQVAGYDALRALTALFNGAFGNAYSLAETGIRSCPLLLSGLAVMLAFRCGFWNIGVEGQFLIGALMTAWTAPFFIGWTPYLAWPMILFSGVFAGALWGAVAGILKVNRQVQEVISTIMLNFIAIQMVSFAVHGPLMEDAGQFPQTDLVTASLRLTRWFPPTRLHSGILVALIIGILVYILLFRTVIGYRIRAVGMNAVAARAAGIPVSKTIIMTICLSGGVAGLAGAIELTGVTYRLYDQFGGGYGYTGIAVALLGRLHPGGVVLSAILFGVLETGANAMQREANVSAVLVYVIQALILLFVLVGTAVSRYWVKRKI